MKALRPKYSFLLFAPLSLVTSVLAAAAYPPYGLPWFVWIAFVPLWFAAEFASSYGAALGYAFLSGFAYYFITIDWVKAFHPAGPFFVAAVSGFFYFALPAVIIRFLLKTRRLDDSRRDLFESVALFAVPAVWVVFEKLKASGYWAFPFGITGYAAGKYERLLQVCDVTGVWGLSYLILAANTAFYILLARAVKHDRGWRSPFALGTAGGLALLFAVLGIYGQARLELPVAPSGLKVALAQSAVPNTVTWQEYQGEILRIVDRDTSLVRGDSPDLIVFPEDMIPDDYTFVPGLWQASAADSRDRIASQARGAGAYLLIGGIELATNAAGEKVYYNDAFLFGRDGALLDGYRKRELVPFGEKFPFVKSMPKFAELLLENGAFFYTPGEPDPEPLSVTASGRDYRFGALVCFEGTYPGLSRRYALKGADLLVNITSDYWSDSLVGMEQHALFSRFRAVENRLPYVRVGNGGITCAIDPAGRVVKELAPMEDNAAVVDLPVLKTPFETFYTRAGDWAVWVCAAMAAAALVFDLVILILSKRGERDVRR